jgi:hypothetical protein
MSDADQDDDIGPQLSLDEAKAIMRAGLGRYELDLVTSFCAPLYWAIRYPDRSFSSQNATTFFLDAGEGAFGVTACHVIDGWLAARQMQDVGPLRIAANGPSPVLDWESQRIDSHRGIDIATYRIARSDVLALGKVVLTGSQKEWPPKRPTVRGGIYYCGYPSIGTRHESPQSAVFGAVRGSGIATSVSDKDVSTLIERQYLMPEPELPPENFDFGGISGGPMITVVQNGLRSWRLAGVIYEGPSTSDDPAQAIAGLEIIRARRADFIRPDGTLDIALWETLDGRLS